METSFIPEMPGLTPLQNWYVRDKFQKGELASRSYKDIKNYTLELKATVQKLSAIDYRELPKEEKRQLSKDLNRAKRFSIHFEKILDILTKQKEEEEYFERQLNRKISSRNYPQLNSEQLQILKDLCKSLGSQCDQVKVIHGFLDSRQVKRKSIWFCKGYLIYTDSLKDAGYRPSYKTCIHAIVLDHEILLRLDSDLRYQSEMWRKPCWSRRFPNMKKDIQEIYKIAKDKSIKEGIKYEVDHKYPVSHPLCCGLTVPWNLQVISKEENRRKSNKADIGVLKVS